MKKITNNLQGSVLNLSAENSNFSLPKQKRVMFKFDDDEPMYLNSIVEEGKFIIELKEGNIHFEKDGKKFQIYIETICTHSWIRSSDSFDLKPHCGKCGINYEDNTTI